MRSAKILLSTLASVVVAASATAQPIRWLGSAWFVENPDIEGMSGTGMGLEFQNNLTLHDLPNGFKVTGWLRFQGPWGTVITPPPPDRPNDPPAESPTLYRLAWKVWRIADAEAIGQYYNISDYAGAVTLVTGRGGTASYVSSVEDTVHTEIRGLAKAVPSGDAWDELEQGEIHNFSATATSVLFPSAGNFILEQEFEVAVSTWTANQTFEFTFTETPGVRSLTYRIPTPGSLGVLSLGACIAMPFRRRR